MLLRVMSRVHLKEAEKNHCYAMTKCKVINLSVSWNATEVTS